MPQPAAVAIASLRDRPGLAAAAARWTWAEWGRRDGRTLAEETAWLAAHTAIAGPPQAFVLFEDGMPAGVATLEHDDLAARPDLTPWLANVVVDPAFRRRGHAALLVRRVERAAAASGIARLYLHTHTAPALYARLGWEAFGTAMHHGHAVTLMRRDLLPG